MASTLTSRIFSPLVLHHALVVAILSGCWLRAAEPEKNPSELLFQSTIPVRAIAISDHVLAWPREDGAIEIKSSPGHPRLRSTNTHEVAELLSKLDADNFADRQTAYDRLAELGHEVQSDLQEFNSATASAEVVSRVSALLATLEVTEDERHDGAVLCLAISADEQLVVSGGKDGKLRFWSAHSGSVFRVIDAHNESVSAVCCSPDNSWVVTGGGDNRICIWSQSSGRRVAVLNAHQSVVQDLAFSLDGKKLASAGGFDRTVLVWDVASRRVEHRLSFEKNSEPLRLAFAAKNLVTAGYGGSVRLWDVETGRLRGTMMHDNTTIGALFVVDEFLLWGNRRGILSVSRLDERKTRLKEHMHAGRLRCIRGNVSRGLIITSGDDGKVVKHPIETFFRK